MATQCKVLGVSRAGFYAWRDRGESDRAREDRRLAVLVRESFARSRRTYGAPRVHADLAAAGEHVSRKRGSRGSCRSKDSRLASGVATSARR